MKKGARIKEITIVEKVVNGISNKIIEATAEDGKPVKLSRTERQLVADYKNPRYVENLKKGFGNPDILAKDFKVYKNGEEKFYIH